MMSSAKDTFIPDHLNVVHYHSGVEMPKARPATNRMEPANRERIASLVRKLERLRSQRDQFLEHAHVNTREAELKMEEDTSVQQQILALAGQDALIEIDGVIYQIDDSGVRPIPKNLL